MSTIVVLLFARYGSGASTGKDLNLILETSSESAFPTNAPTSVLHKTRIPTRSPTTYPTDSLSLSKISGGTEYEGNQIVGEPPTVMSG